MSVFHYWNKNEKVSFLYFSFLLLGIPNLYIVLMEALWLFLYMILGNKWLQEWIKDIRPSLFKSLLSRRWEWLCCALKV